MFINQITHEPLQPGADKLAERGVRQIVVDTDMAEAMTRGSDSKLFPGMQIVATYVRDENVDDEAATVL